MPDAELTDWVPFKNDSAFAVPPFGLVKPSGPIDPDTGSLPATRPDEASEEGLLVNGETSVSPGGFGRGTPSPRVVIAYDPAAGVPAVGDSLGSAAGSFFAAAGSSGFKALSPGAGGRVNAVRVPGGGCCNYCFVATTGGFGLVLLPTDSVDVFITDSLMKVPAGPGVAVVRGGLTVAYTHDLGTGTWVFCYLILYEVTTGVAELRINVPLASTRRDVVTGLTGDVYFDGSLNAAGHESFTSIFNRLVDRTFILAVRIRRFGPPVGPTLDGAIQFQYSNESGDGHLYYEEKSNDRCGSAPFFTPPTPPPPIATQPSASPATPGDTHAAGRTLTFAANATGTTSPTFAWDFGDGTTATGDPATHTYAAAGPDVAAVVVTDGGDTATGILPVAVVWGGELSLPAAFPKTNTTFSAVPELTATVGVGKYRFEADLFFTPDATGQMKVCLDGTATVTNVSWDRTIDTGSARTVFGATRHLAFGTGETEATGAVTDARMRIAGYFEATAAGTVGVKAAQVSASGTSYLDAGSTLSVTPAN